MRSRESASGCASRNEKTSGRDPPWSQSAANRSASQPPGVTPAVELMLLPPPGRSPDAVGSQDLSIAGSRLVGDVQLPLRECATSVTPSQREIRGQGHPV